MPDAVRRLALVTVLALAPAAPLAGQGALRDTTPVPRELALALLGSWGFPGEGGPEIVTGRLPAALPAAIVPTGARVLGGLAFGASSGEVSRLGTAVLVSPLPAADAQASVEGQLERSGWRRPPTPIERGGFVMETGRPVTFCRDSALAFMVTARARPAGGSFVTVSASDAGRYSPCRADGDRSMRGPFEDFPMPTLVPPPRAAALESGGGGGNDSREARVRLRISLDPSDLVAHFAPQLVRAGWTLTDQARTGGLALQTATLRDARGRSFQGVLTAVTIAGTAERDVTFRIIRAVGAGR